MLARHFKENHHLSILKYLYPAFLGRLAIVSGIKTGRFVAAMWPLLVPIPPSSKPSNIDRPPRLIPMVEK